MKPIHLRLVLAGLLATLAASPAIARDDVIVDEDYRFELRQPTGWTLLREADVRKIVPDAIAGARMPTSPSAHGVIIVERVPKEDMDWYAGLILGNLPLENKRMIRQEDVPFQGVTARKTMMVGRVSNLDVRYQVMLFFRRGFAFQVTTWGLQALTKADGSDFKPFIDAIKLLDGPIKPRKYVAKTPDVIGTGWQVKDNRFRSAISGLQVVPPDGWRLVIGDELAAMNEDAEVGLVSTIDPEAYMVITPERAAGVPRAEMDAQYARGLLETHGASTVAPLVASVAGQRVSLKMYGGKSKDPFDFRHGVLWDGEMACQVLIWYGAPYREKATAHVKRALTGITRMSDTDRAALHATLEEHGNQQRFVGPTFSLRGGTYTDYESGITWSAPAGIWKITAGQEARQAIEGARLLIEAPTEGVMGMLRHDPGLNMDAPTYHHKVLEALWGPEDAKKALVGTKEVRVEGQPPLRTSRSTRRVGTQIFTYVVATGMNGPTGTRLLVWGYPGNVASSVQWLKDAIQGLQLKGAPGKAAERRDDRWIDRRLGFEMRSPHPQWRFREETPAALRPAGSLIRWAGPTEYVQALGVCNVGIAENTGEVLRTMLDNASRPFGGKPIRTGVRIQGLLAQQLDWPRRARAWTVVRGRMIYMLIHEWKPGSTPTAGPRILQRFRLLD